MVIGLKIIKNPVFYFNLRLIKVKLNWKYIPRKRLINYYSKNKLLQTFSIALLNPPVEKKNNNLKAINQHPLNYG